MKLGSQGRSSSGEGSGEVQADGGVLWDITALRSGPASAPSSQSVGVWSGPFLGGGGKRVQGRQSGRCGLSAAGPGQLGGGSGRHHSLENREAAKIPCPKHVHGRIRMIKGKRRTSLPRGRRRYTEFFFFFSLPRSAAQPRVRIGSEGHEEARGPPGCDKVTATPTPASPRWLRCPPLVSPVVAWAFVPVPVHGTSVPSVWLLSELPAPPGGVFSALTRCGIRFCGCGRESLRSRTKSAAAFKFMPPRRIDSASARCRSHGKHGGYDLAFAGLAAGERSAGFWSPEGREGLRLWTPDVAEQALV